MYVSINIVPQSLRQAVIATEDRRFYSHGPSTLSASSAPPQSTSIPAKP
nr:transglycosylase domain-containing protein [Megasphaera sp. SW808]